MYVSSWNGFITKNMYFIELEIDNRKKIQSKMHSKSNKNSLILFEIKRIRWKLHEKLKRKNTQWTILSKRLQFSNSKYRLNTDLLTRKLMIISCYPAYQTYIMANDWKHIKTHQIASNKKIYLSTTHKRVHRTETERQIKIKHKKVIWWK